MTRERVTVEILQASFQRAVRSAQDAQYIYGRLGRQEEDGTYTVEVPNRPRYLYVLVDGEQSPTIAYNEGVNPTGNDGIPVRMLIIRGVLTIVGINVEELHAYKRGDPYHPTDHGNVSGLTDDDHTQYALLAGRSGGQALQGGTASGDDLTLESTAHATKGDVLLNPNGGNVGIGTDAPGEFVHAYKDTDDLVRVRVENPNAGTGARAEFMAFADGVLLSAAAFGPNYVGSHFGETRAGAAALLASSNQITKFLIGSLVNVPVYFGNNNIARMSLSGGQVNLLVDTQAYALMGINATPTTDAQMLIESGAATRNALRLRAAASASEPVLEVQDSSGTEQWTVSDDGAIQKDGYSHYSDITSSVASGAKFVELSPGVAVGNVLYLITVMHRQTGVGVTPGNNRFMQFFCSTVANGSVDGFEIDNYVHQTNMQAAIHTSSSGVHSLKAQDLGGTDITLNNDVVVTVELWSNRGDKKSVTIFP